MFVHYIRCNAIARVKPNRGVFVIAEILSLQPLGKAKADAGRLHWAKPTKNNKTKGKIKNCAKVNGKPDKSCS